ncbi:hypothetical protein Tco_0578107 [Tanacetum coccineum]
MNPIASQQAALDNSLVASEKRLKIKRCNARIAFIKPQKEETYQVTLEALKLSPCYPAFQISAEVLKIYMHQFWNTINKIGNTDAYNFKLDKKKCISGKSTGPDRLRESRVQILTNLHTARDDSLLSALKFVSKTEECQKYGALIPDGMINDNIKLSTAYKTYLDYATGKVPPKKTRKFKKPASPKLMTVPASPKEPTQKAKRVKRPAKKATTTLTIGVVIRFTPVNSVSKKKAPAKAERGKGIELLSDAALLEEAQLKKTLRKSKQETHKLQASGSNTSKGTGVKPRVPDVSKADSSDSDNESWGDSEDESDDVHDEDGIDDDDGNGDDSGNDDDGGNDAQDSERTNSDDDENPSFTLKDYKEEEQEDEYMHTQETDKSVDEKKMHEEEDDYVAKEEDQQNASHESLFVQEEDDGHVTLTIVHDKTEGIMQSSFVSSNFTSKLLNLDNTSSDVNEIAFLMNTSTVPPPPPLVNPSSHLTIITQPQTPYSTTKTTNLTMNLAKIPNFASLFQFDQRLSTLETKMFEFNQTSQFAKAVYSILGIVDQYLASKMKEAVDVAVWLQSNKLKEEVEAENQEFFNQVDSTMKAIIKEQVKAQVSKIMPQIEKYVTKSLGAEVLVRSINQSTLDVLCSSSFIVRIRIKEDSH